MIRFLKDRMSSISSDLYEEILKPNKSHANRIIQIVPSKTALSLEFQLKTPRVSIFSVSTLVWSILNLNKQKYLERCKAFMIELQR